MTTKKLSRKTLAIVGITAIGSLGLAACGSSDDDSTTETVTEVSTVTETNGTETTTVAADNIEGTAEITTLDLDGSSVDTSALSPISYSVKDDGGVREIDIDDARGATAELDIDLELRNDAWILDDFTVEIDGTEWEASSAQEAAATVEVSDDESSVRIETEVHDDDNEQVTANIVIELELN